MAKAILSEEYFTSIERRLRSALYAPRSLHLVHLPHHLAQPLRIGGVWIGRSDAWDAAIDAAVTTPHSRDGVFGADRRRRKRVLNRATAAFRRSKTRIPVALTHPI